MRITLKKHEPLNDVESCYSFQELCNTGAIKFAQISPIQIHTKKMKEKTDKLNQPESQEDNDEENNLPGYPVYPEGEDIYSIYMEEREINPEDISKTKEPTQNYKVGTGNEKNFNDDFSGSDLDIPGSELNDDMENIGIEDEENNYYSLGGDDHDDLEENQGE